MTRITRRRFNQLGASALAAPAVLGAAPARAAATITLGGTVPLTGQTAATGRAIADGYRTAVRYFNETLRGIVVGTDRMELRLRLDDDAGDPANATTLLQRQIDDGVSLFLGSFSSATLLPTSALIERTGKLMIQAGGAADEIFTTGQRRTFGLFPRASRQFISSANWFEKLNPRPTTAIVVAAKDAFSKRQAEDALFDLNDAGFNVLGGVELDTPVTDAANLMAAIQRFKPTMVVCTTRADNSLAIARAMAAAGANAPVVYQSLGPLEPSYRQALGTQAEGIAAPTFWSPSFTYRDPYFGSAQAFADDHQANGSEPLTYHVAAAAACVECYVRAIETANTPTDVDGIRAAVAALDFETFYSRIRFTPQGDGDPQRMGPAVAQIQYGTLAIVHPQEATTTSAFYPKPNW